MRSLSFDWVLFLLGLALSISGLVYVYSATWEAGDTPGVFFSLVEIKQIVWLVIALVVHHFVRRVNWGLRPESWLWFYVPVAAALALVLAIGASHGMGANRWISIGPVDIQPSEFAKLAFILILAWLFSREGMKPDRAYLTALGVLLSLLALVLLQPDLGTAMVFVVVFFVMALFTPVRRRLILATLVAFMLCGIFAWQFLFYEHQRNRIKAFLDPKADPQGIGYQINQSEIAVGSGGLTGKGFLRGTREALSEKGRPNLTLTLPDVSARSLGALIALFERTVGLYAENLFDDRSINYVHPEAFIDGRYGVVRPRTVGVRFAYRY